MENRKSTYTIIFIVITACLIMGYVDAIISPPYMIKSLIKLSLFLALPLLFCLRDKSISFKNLFKANKKSISRALILGICVYGIILGAYFILGPFFDMSMITTSLENNIGVNKSNFVFVAIYISFVNSLLEEFFFRGFAFLSLKEVSNRKLSYIFSSLAFSLYHIAIMTNWFGLTLYMILIVSLFVGGLIFDWLNEKYNNIYSSWLVHMCANFAINTVGFILFGIL